MKHLVIDKRVIRNNIRAVKEKADGAAIYADLSANAYGMGLGRSLSFYATREYETTSSPTPAMLPFCEITALRKSAL